MTGFGNAGMMGLGLLTGVMNAKTKQYQDKINLQMELAQMTMDNQRVLVTQMATYRATETEARSIQEQYKAEVVDQKIAAAQARGAIKAASGASGTGGSMGMRVDNVTKQTARNLSRLTINKDNAIEAVQVKQSNAQKEAQARFQLMPKQKLESNSSYSIAGLTNGVGIGLQGIQAKNSWDSYKASQE